MGTDTKESADDKAPKNRGVGEVAMEAIRAGKSNEEALAAVKAELPGAKTSMSSINWYRNDMRKNNEDVKTSRELKKIAKDKAAKAAPKTAAKPAKDPLDE